MRKNTRIISISYFIVHMLVEMVCFNVLYATFNNNGLIWGIALLYDFLAFVPQGLIGDFFNCHRNLNLPLVGIILMTFGVGVIYAGEVYCAGNFLLIFGLVCLAIGNGVMHETGAYATMVLSDGMLFPSALFVAGGSFGVVIGQFTKLSSTGNFLFRIICLLAMVIICLATDKLWIDERNEPEFTLVRDDCSFSLVIMIAMLVVAARSYIGYCIPISWKKEIWQAFLLFFVMGAGKATGGYLADKYGSRKVAIYSTLLSVPFLVFGNDYMLISIFGVFMFSLTMAITFGMILSVIKDNIGIAFGLTTIGLFMGTLPVIFFGLLGTAASIVFVVVLSLGCSYGLSKTLK